MLRQLVSGSLISVGGLGGSMAFRFLTSVLTARLLLPDGYGTYAFITWLIFSVVLLCGRGTPAALTRFMAECATRGDGPTRALLCYAWRAVLPLTLLGAAACAVGVELHFRTDGQLVGPVFAATVSGVLAQVAMAAAQGARRYRGVGSVNLATAALVLVGNPLAIQLGTGLAGLLWVLSLSQLLQVVVLAAFSLRQYTVPGGAEANDPELLDSFKRYSTYSLLIALLNAVVWQRSEVAFLTIFRDAAETGLYSVAFGLVTMVSQLITGGLGMVLLPTMADAEARNEPARVARLFERSTRYLALLAYPTYALLLVLGPPLVERVYGAAYQQAGAILWLLGLAATLGTVSTATSVVQFSKNRPELVFKTGLVVAILNVILDFLLIPAFGLHGAALANLVAQATAVAIGTTIAVRLAGARFPLRELARIGLASAAVGIVALPLAQGGPILITAPLAALLAPLVLFVALAALRAFADDDLRIFDYLLQPLPATLRSIIARLRPIVAARCAASTYPTQSTGPLLGQVSGNIVKG